MAGFPLPLPFWATDDVGAPLAAGLLYTYAAGTSTPLATYSDQALTTANANPIVLDAAGRATIYVSDGVSYKLVAKTAAGVTVWTRDNWSVPDVEAPAATSAVPVGGIILYGAAAAPSGYLVCNGAAVSRTTYSALFAAISTAFGVGNGSTTFNVPDMRQRFPLGVAASGTGNVLGATGGAIDHVHAGSSHVHTVAAHVHTLAHTHIVPRDGWGAVLNMPAATGRIAVGEATGAGQHTNAYQATADVASGGVNTPNTGGQALTSDASGTGNTGTGNSPFTAVTFIIKT